MIPRTTALLKIHQHLFSFCKRHCVGWTHGFTDFECPLEAAANCQIGSALSFNRIGFYHFAIYLGLDQLTKEHLVVHLWGGGRNADQSKLPEDERLQSVSQLATVRIDSLSDVAAGDTVRVYHCGCNDDKRALVVKRALAELGNGDYDLASNNCENFVRRIIDDMDISYQTYWTGAAPIIQIPRLLVGAALRGSFSSCSASLNASAASGQVLTDLWSKLHSTCEITDPTGRLLRLVRNRQTQHWELINRL